jgi:hypothetical protein
MRREAAPVRRPPRGARALAARRAASATKPLTSRGDREEDDQREEVLALADRERVERRGEVPVDEEESDDRGERGQSRRRGDRTTRGGERSNAREARCVAELAEHPGEQRETDGGEQKPSAPAARKARPAGLGRARLVASAPARG